MPMLLLFESASGFALLERVAGDEVGESVESAQESARDPSRFLKAVRLHAFLPFRDERDALQAINNLSEGVLDPTLRAFLEQNIPRGGGGGGGGSAKKSKKAAAGGGAGERVLLGVAEEKLAGAIDDALGESLGLKVVKSPYVGELLRGVRLHFARFLESPTAEADTDKARRGLAHSYSRGKVKFNVNRVDNMIIQSIALLDQLDKDINTFAMRVREWYSWHFPELQRLVPDNLLFARAAGLIGDKAKLAAGGTDNELVSALSTLLGDEERAKALVEAASHSMGRELSELDLVNIGLFSSRVVELASYRHKLQQYLHKKMTDVAPNLDALMGDQVGARLIAHAGSLINLAKYPASTIQILGAEKALFRALKTRGATPKYGLIFHSSFIGRASAKNKGRISRYLANKAAIAARVDSFADSQASIFGQRMAEQVEDRLRFYETGVPPKKNLDVMREAVLAVASAAHNDDGVAPDDEDSSAAPRAPAAKKRKDKPAKEEKQPKEKGKTKKKHKATAAAE